MTKSRYNPSSFQPNPSTLLVLFWSLSLWALPAIGVEKNPLKPIETSSPRATLQGFIEFMNKGYGDGIGFMQSYLDSSRLYMTPEEAEIMQESLHYQEAAQRALDLSEVPPAMARESARRLAIQLKEVLDRIEIPPFESIPDAEAMEKAEFKRWTLPNSEIRIRRAESGPQAGEYLFSPETVVRLPEFYEKIKALPYKSGASVGWNDFSSYGPVGVAFALRHIIPPRWLVDSPKPRNRTLFLDQPLWRWACIAAVLGAGFAAVLSGFRLSRFWALKTQGAHQWLNLLRPMTLVITAPLAVLILDEVLRVSGTVYQVLTLSLWTLFYLALTWTVWVAGGAVADSLSAIEKLQVGSIDSQLIRLVMRLLTVAASILILVAGADRVGLPAYSVMAGLGVGGLAVALAAQQTLANLLGSLIIMFEKPFAVGDTIKLNDMEGIVESVGFRSTRIRTLHNSLVTIPSSQLVNSIIDNMELRDFRQVKTVLGLTYDTPAGKIEEFVNAIRYMLETHPGTRKDNIQVVLDDLGPYSLGILVNFFLKVPDRAAELAERQRIFLAILHLAESAGVQFAFPTQTLHIESLPDYKAIGGFQAGPVQNQAK